MDRCRVSIMVFVKVIMTKYIKVTWMLLLVCSWIRFSISQFPWVVGYVFYLQIDICQGLWFLRCLVKIPRAFYKFFNCSCFASISLLQQPLSFGIWKKGLQGHQFTSTINDVVIGICWALQSSVAADGQYLWVPLLFTFYIWVCAS